MLAGTKALAIDANRRRTFRRQIERIGKRRELAAFGSERKRRPRAKRHSTAARRATFIHFDRRCATYTQAAGKRRDGIEHERTATRHRHAASMIIVVFSNYLAVDGDCGRLRRIELRGANRQRFSVVDCICLPIVLACMQSRGRISGIERRRAAEAQIVVVRRIEFNAVCADDQRLCVQPRPAARVIDDAASNDCRIVSVRSRQAEVPRCAGNVHHPCNDEPPAVFVDRIRRSRRSHCRRSHNSSGVYTHIVGIEQFTVDSHA